MTVRISTLDNGLRVVSDDMPGVRTASVGIWVDAGTRNETPEINGAAHLLEHMAFKGTERRSALAIAEEIEAVGGHLNAYTSREQTAYYARVLDRDVGLAVDILGDILQHSTFIPDEMERERDVVIQEIGQANDTPDDIVFDHLQIAAFPDQALGRPVLGTEETVRGMDRRALIGFMKEHYRAPAMVMVAAGAVDHDQIVDLTHAHCAALPTGGPSPTDRARFAAHERREERDLDQAHIALAFPGVSYQDDDYFAVQVYATLLGGGMSSRLFQEIRERRGLAYSVFAAASSYNDGGLFTVYAGTSPDSVGDLVPVVADEMLKTLGTIGEDELQRARAQLKVGLLMSLESSAARIEQLGRQMLIFGRPLDIDQVVAEIEAVDTAAVGRAVRRLLAVRPALAAIGPLRRLEDYDRVAARFAA